jgi:tetratricopeptide (TPR) repeat protein
MCSEGVNEYPWYATGALVLGACYEELGRASEATIAYRRALSLLPDSAVLQRAVGRSEQREQEEFQSFAERQEQTLEAKKNSQTFAQYAADGAADQISTAEFLLKQVASRKSSPLAPRKGEEIQDDGSVREASPRIVTVTLAEIYASQGEYREAIDAYRKLVERHPEEAVRYLQRLEELEWREKQEKPLP